MAIDFFDELSREMWDITRGSLEPLTYISETEDTIIVEVDLPMVKKGDIHLRLIDEGLEIEASLYKCVKFERWGTIQKDCEFRSFYKRILLPNPVSTEGSKAIFKRGILKVTLKKIKGEHKIYVE